MTDFVLIADGGLKIKVVKAFLLLSPYFESILRKDWMENELEQLHVSIPSVFLNAIVDFLYNGTIM